MIPSNTIPNVDWLILGAEIKHVVVINNKYDIQVVEKIPYCRM